MVTLTFVCFVLDFFLPCFLIGGEGGPGVVSITTLNPMKNVINYGAKGKYGMVRGTSNSYSVLKSVIYPLLYLKGKCVSLRLFEFIIVERGR